MQCSANPQFERVYDSFYILYHYCNNYYIILKLLWKLNTQVPCDSQISLLDFYSRNIKFLNMNACHKFITWLLKSRSNLTVLQWVNDWISCVTPQPWVLLYNQQHKPVAHSTNCEILQRMMMSEESIAQCHALYKNIKCRFGHVET